MVILSDASLSFGEQCIFDRVNLNLQPGEKIGILGRNGAGKSTLLEVLAGEHALDEGSVSIADGVRIGYMPQQVVFDSEETVYHEVLKGAAAYQAVNVEVPQLEQRLADPASLERYSDLMERYTRQDALAEKASAEEILVGLGFGREWWDKPVSELSVGWKMRVVLAKLLLTKADLYLFDEPTNHLDLPAKQWFVRFLKELKAGFLLVTHDRYFLDHSCDSIISLERGKAVRYYGTYTGFIQDQKKRMSEQRAAYDRQQREIAQKRATIERFRAQASKAKMAQSMEKKLAQIEPVTCEYEVPAVTVSFAPVERSGKQVLTVEGVRHAFDETQLFTGVSGTVMRGDKIALIAPNGTGKTTLFNLIAGLYPLQGGSIARGHKVTTALFEQDQHEALDGDNEIIEEVARGCEVPDGAIRSLLGSFLFSGDSIFKKINVLSGGEKNRVALVKVLLAQANFLLLDEPTNHLDLISKEVLLKALQAYEGTILFVSHDQSFLQGLATKVWELTPRGLHIHHGGYDTLFHAPRTEQQRHCEQTQVQDGTREHKKQITALERAIAKQEQAIARLEEAFEKLMFGTPAYDTQVSKLAAAQKNLDELVLQWETAMTQ